MTNCIEVANDTPLAATILNFQSAHDGWRVKADILATNGIEDGRWNAAIAGLIASGRVERQNEKRGTRYQAVSTGEEK